jgi:hypothetical protein
MSSSTTGQDSLSKPTPTSTGGTSTPSTSTPSTSTPGTSTQATSTQDKVSFARESAHDRQSVLKWEKEEYGGIKAGLAFFGWLTATGTAVLLTTFVAAAGTALGVATHLSAGRATTQVEDDPRTVGIAGAAILLVVLFASYYCGGYVAARMARFHGVRQGMAVWLWAVFIAAVVAVLAALAGGQFDLMSWLNRFPRIPVSRGNLTTGGLIALVVAASGSLAGSLLGGLAGMHFHRKVDKAGYGK